MFPIYQKGDILFLDNRADIPLQVGELVVFKVTDRPIPIVHRIVQIYNTIDGEV